MPPPAWLAFLLQNPAVFRTVSSQVGRALPFLRTLPFASAARATATAGATLGRAAVLPAAIVIGTLGVGVESAVRRLSGHSKYLEDTKVVESQKGVEPWDRSVPRWQRRADRQNDRGTAAPTSSETPL
mmetsp:Transcript_5414/g.17495  ORF Transcript_5414/g.17495 Transcript_5414/m.17495 type:complete len:128 (-) Transcript_5414:2029-2412(-)